jgi:hypothetical protein
VSKKPLDDFQENMPQQDAIKRENKTIYEMITHLCGRPLPAIPVGAPVPHDIKERSFQFNWQHNVLLKFLEYISYFLLKIANGVKLKFFVFSIYKFYQRV